MDVSNKIYYKETKIDKVPLAKLAKMHLFIKLADKNIESEFSDRNLNILAELFVFGGIDSKERANEFLQHCYGLSLSKEGADNSIRNTLGLGRKFGVVKRKKCNHWQIHEDYLTKLNSDTTLFKYTLTNISAKKS